MSQKQQNNILLLKRYYLNTRISVHLNGKGLCIGNTYTEQYYQLYSNYLCLLEKYILSKLPLIEYENRLKNSGLRFLPVPDDSKDFYQSISGLDLDFIYLRNDLCVEKLSYEDIQILLNLSKMDLANPNHSLFDLVERTYSDIINIAIEDENIIHMVRYGPDIDEYWKDSRNLVLGIRYDEFGENGLGNGKLWLDNYDNQMELLGNVMRELEEKCKGLLSVKINFLYYDDATTRRSMLR